MGAGGVGSALALPLSLFSWGAGEGRGRENSSGAGVTRGGGDGGSEGWKAPHPALVRILSLVPELLGREGIGETAQNVHCP